VWMNARGDWKNKDLYNSPADIISPNSGSEDYLNNPPHATGKKVILADSDHIGHFKVTYPWVYKSMTRGLQPLLVDPAYYGYTWWQGDAFKPRDPQLDKIRRAMGHALSYVNKMDLAAAVPQAKGTNAPVSTGYCLYQAGERYLIYQPTPASFIVYLRAGIYDYEWVHPIKGKSAHVGTTKWPGGNKTFNPPFYGDSVLYLARQRKPHTLFTR